MAKSKSFPKLTLSVLRDLLLNKLVLSHANVRQVKAGVSIDAIYPRLAREEGVAFYPFLLDGVGGEAALNQRDGIHPNPQGGAVFAGKLAPFIAGVIVAGS